jgi:hypothetical protein
MSSTAVPAGEVYIRSTDDDGSRIPGRLLMAKKNKLYILLKTSRKDFKAPAF